MRIFYTAHFRRRLKQCCKKNPQLKIKIKRQIELFQKDIYYPSLRTHKLKGKRIDEMAFWIEGNLRIVFVRVRDDFIFTDMIIHDEY